MSAPDVSILMAAYNAERYLGEALTSILEQTGISLELIVVDDGSTDHTPGILDDFARRDPRLRVLHRANQGCMPARNEAFAHALGRYIMLMDADDRIRPGKLEKQTKFLDNHPDYGAVYCDTWFINSQGAEIAKHSRCRPGKRPAGDIFEFIVGRNWMTVHSVLARRECFERCGLHDLKHPYVIGDWDLWTRLAAEYLFYYQDEALVDYRFHPDMSHLPRNQSLIRNMFAGTIARIAALPRFQTISPRGRARYYFYCGKYFLEVGEPRPARQALWKAIQANPCHGLAWCALAFTFMGRHAFHRCARVYRRLCARINKRHWPILDPPWVIGNQ